MAKGKKYDIVIEQIDTRWSAKITRQVTSRKVTITRQESNFSGEAIAREWAEQQMAELVETQKARNERHGKSRREQQEEREQRAARRSEKTQKSKQEKMVETTDDRGDDVAMDESNSWAEELKSLSAENSGDQVLEND